MKRSPIIMALATLALIACGDNGGLPAGPDGTTETAATLTVTRLGVPVADYPVLVHDDNGTLTAEATTDRAGVLRFDTGDSASVTVATELGNLVTIAGIRPGDEVEWTPEPEARRGQVGTVDLTASGIDIAADQFRYMACGRTETGTASDETVSIAIDNGCLRGNGDLSVLAVATDLDEAGQPELVAFTGRRRVVPKIGENTVIDFGDWQTDWDELPMSVQRPTWATSDAALTARSSVVFEGFDYQLPAITSAEEAMVRFPAGYDDERVAALTWSQDTGFGATARASQWFNPDRHTAASVWPTPPTILNASFDQDRPVVSWDGKLGNAIATEITWSTDEGFKTWTMINRGDSHDAAYPELTGVGSFTGPGGALSDARAVGLVRGAAGYSALLESGVAAQLVWDEVLRRSVASGSGAQLTEIHSNEL